MKLRNFQTLCRSRRLEAVLPPSIGMIDKCHKNHTTATWVLGLDRSGLVIVNASLVTLNWLQRCWYACATSWDEEMGLAHCFDSRPVKLNKITSYLIFFWRRFQTYEKTYLAYIYFFTETFKAVRAWQESKPSSVFSLSVKFSDTVTLSNITVVA